MKKGFGVVLCISGSALVVLGLANNVEFSQSSHSHVSLSKNGTQILNRTNISHEYPTQPKHEVRKILTTTTSSFLVGLGLCALHAFMEAGYMFCSKTLYDQVEDIQVLNFWCISGSTALSIVLMIGFEYKKLTLPSQLDDIMFLSTHVLTTGIGQVLNFALLELLSFIAIGIVINLEIPMGMLCQYILAPGLQPIKGGIFDLIGTIIIKRVLLAEAQHRRLHSTFG